MKFFISLTSLMVGLLLFSCSPRVITSRPTDVDLSKYSSFAYLPNADVEMNDQTDKDKVNGFIIDKVNAEMEQQGYSLDRDNPDLLVLISTRTETETRIDKDPVYVNYAYATYPYAAYGRRAVSPYYSNYYYNSFYDYDRVVGYDKGYYQVELGTLVIMLVDRETGKTVWRGMTSDAITELTTTEEMISLVDKVFDEYPLERSAR